MTEHGGGGPYGSAEGEQEREPRRQGSDSWFVPSNDRYRTQADYEDLYGPGGERPAAGASGDDSGGAFPPGAADALPRTGSAPAGDRYGGHGSGAGDRSGASPRYPDSGSGGYPAPTGGSFPDSGSGGYPGMRSTGDRPAMAEPYPSALGGLGEPVKHDSLSASEPDQGPAQGDDDGIYRVPDVDPAAPPTGGTGGYPGFGSSTGGYPGFGASARGRAESAGKSGHDAEPSGPAGGRADSGSQFGGWGEPPAGGTPDAPSTAPLFLPSGDPGSPEGPRAAPSAGGSLPSWNDELSDGRLAGGALHADPPHGAAAPYSHAPLPEPGRNPSESAAGEGGADSAGSYDWGRLGGGADRTGSEPRSEAGSGVWGAPVPDHSPAWSYDPLGGSLSGPQAAEGPSAYGSARNDGENRWESTGSRGGDSFDSGPRTPYDVDSASSVYAEGRPSAPEPEGTGWDAYAGSGTDANDPRGGEAPRDSGFGAGSATDASETWRDRSGRAGADDYDELSRPYMEGASGPDEGAGRPAEPQAAESEPAASDGGLGTGSGNTWAFSSDDERLPQSVRDAAARAEQRRRESASTRETRDFGTVSPAPPAPDDPLAAIAAEQARGRESAGYGADPLGDPLGEPKRSEPRTDGDRWSDPLGSGHRSEGVGEPWRADPADDGGRRPEPLGDQWRSDPLGDGGRWSDPEVAPRSEPRGGGIDGYSAYPNDDPLAPGGPSAAGTGSTAAGDELGFDGRTRSEPGSYGAPQGSRLDAPDPGPGTQEFPALGEPRSFGGAANYGQSTQAMPVVGDELGYDGRDSGAARGGDRSYDELGPADLNGTGGRSAGDAYGAPPPFGGGSGGQESFAGQAPYGAPVPPAGTEAFGGPDPFGGPGAYGSAGPEGYGPPAPLGGPDAYAGNPGGPGGTGGYDAPYPGDAHAPYAGGSGVELYGGHRGPSPQDGPDGPDGYGRHGGPGGPGGPANGAYAEPYTEPGGERFADDDGYDDYEERRDDGAGRRSRGNGGGRDPIAEEFPGFGDRPLGGSPNERYPGYDNVDYWPETSGLALRTLWLGIIGLIPLIGLFTAIAALITGPKARRAIKASNGELEGANLVTIGTVVAVVGLLVNVVGGALAFLYLM